MSQSSAPTPSSEPTPIRLGCVEYLNTLPLIAGLESWRDAELVYAVPSRLVDLLQAGRDGGPGVDLALVSLLDVAKAGGELSVLPCGMIGSDDKTYTVRLFSRVPIDQITAVHADTDSHTSVALVQIVLNELHGLRPEMIDFDARERMAISGGAEGCDEEGWPETMLLIGDKVVVDSPPAVRYPHHLDLGHAWRELTGMTFVYAAWTCRSSDVADPESETARRIFTAAGVLERQRRHNATRLDHVAAVGAKAKGWPRDLATTYLSEYLRYDVDEAAIGAAQAFLDRCATLGLAPSHALSWVGAGS